MNRSICKVLSSFAYAAMLWGCGEGRPSFLQGQMCVHDKNGMGLFVDELKTIAAARKMRFIDSSEKTRHELDAAGYPGK